MCIMVYKPTNVHVPKKTLQRCFTRNDDGAGFMWADDEGLHVKRGYMQFKEFYKTWRAEVTNENPAVLHFRIRTSGTYQKFNTHPHRIRGGLGIAHNGILPKWDRSSKYSDTYMFVKHVLERLPKGWYENEAIVDLLEGYIGLGNKMCLMDNLGKVVIFNRDQGEWEGGCWYSNGSYRPYKTITYSGTPKKVWRGHGGKTSGSVHGIASTSVPSTDLTKATEWDGPLCRLMEEGCTTEISLPLRTEEIKSEDIDTLDDLSPVEQTEEKLTSTLAEAMTGDRIDSKIVCYYCFRTYGNVSANTGVCAWCKCVLNQGAYDSFFTCEDCKCLSVVPLKTCYNCGVIGNPFGATDDDDIVDMSFINLEKEEEQLLLGNLETGRSKCHGCRKDEVQRSPTGNITSIYCEDCHKMIYGEDMCCICSWPEAKTYVQSDGSERSYCDECVKDFSS